jgi:hypothetical protein
MACTITSLILVAMFGVIAGRGWLNAPASREARRLAKTVVPPQLARATRRVPGAFQVLGGPACRRGRSALDQWGSCWRS